MGGDWNREKCEAEKRAELNSNHQSQEDSESWEDDQTWLCDGSKKFLTGCKSGQTDFGEHKGIGGWTCLK